jgi:hypothetical protein
VALNGITVFEGKVPRRAVTMLKTWTESTDPSFIFPVEITVSNDLDKDPRFTRNLALGRPVSTSANHEKCGTSDTVVDGITAKAWWASNHDPDHWCAIDLGATSRVEGCQIVWHGISLYQYKVEGLSASKAAWEILVDETRNPLARQLVEHRFEATDISKVRLTATGIGVVQMGLNEFQIFGTQDAEVEPADEKGRRTKTP